LNDITVHPKYCYKNLQLCPLMIDVKKTFEEC